MAWFSILPDNLSDIERWAARIFLLLGLITIGPWAMLLVYDILLYSWRSIAYEIPVVGGRARGKRKPRAPSLTERPGGKPRRFSLTHPGSLSDAEAPPRVSDSTATDAGDVRRRDRGAGFEE